MMSRFRLLLIMFISGAAATVITTSQKVSGEPNATIEDLATVEPDCTRWSTYFDRRPKVSTCNRAIRLLPPQITMGKFHIDGEDDEFRLPVSKVSGDCEVTVDFSPGEIEDNYFWFGIQVAASRLSSACQEMGKLQTTRTGGWLLTGISEKIRVTLAKPLRSVLQGNVTVSDGLLIENATSTE